MIKASKLSRINDRRLPGSLKILHYVYSQRYYDYRCDRDKVIVNNEVALFRFDVLPNLDLSRYTKDITYFLFTNSLHTNVRAEIESGSAQGLTCAEAQAIHDYLLKSNMVCVFAEIQKKYAPQLYNKLVCALEDANKRQKPKHIVHSALAAKERLEQPLESFPVYLEEVCPDYDSSPKSKRKRDWESQSNYERVENKRPRY